ncbi:MAG: YerC/YecD family TrpR-related protein [Clostridia bacterium]|nr:YerC/YecD family TrpR-related protein [Clostridia bacterium]
MFHSQIESKEINELFEAMRDIESVEDFYKFFDDLCTFGELQTMSQRFQVARMLDEGKTFAKICEETGASTATITRVNKALHYGPGGYRLALDIIKNKEDKDEQ